MAKLFAALQRLGPTLAGVLVLLLVLFLQFLDTQALQRLRLQVFDTYQVMSPREDSGQELVAVVDIDEASIATLGQWPWPRTDLATLTRRLGEAGATVVAYDIVFSEPDRTSPEAIIARYQQLGRGEGLDASLADLPSHDDIFAKSFDGVPVVVGAFLDPHPIGRDFEPKAPFAISGSLPSREVLSFPGALLPIPEIEDAASGVGTVTIGSDIDQITRRASLVAIHQDELVPLLALEAVRVARDAGSPILVASDGTGQLDGPGAAVAIRLADTEIPVNGAGEMWVHFHAEGSHDNISAAEIITGAKSDAELREEVEGKIVFVGGSAQGLQDLISTPFDDRIEGVSIHAAVAEQILEGDFLERPDWALALEITLTLGLGLGLALLLPRIGSVFGAMLSLAAMALAIAVSWLAFKQASYLLDPISTLLAILVVYLVQTAFVFFREEQQRQYIRSAFDRYLSPEMVRQIAASPDKLELGGEERDMSVLMCDVRGFSRISEQYSPKEVIDFLIEFLTPMSDILMAHKATLDKYIGDAILAFWNAPLDDPDHAANAARAALEMIAVTDELNRTMPEKDGVVWPGEVKIGIGINAGMCCVGNMGSKKRLAYTLIGDTVNVASRLEGLTKQYGVPIMIGGSMAERLPGFAMLELDRVRVVGRDAPATVVALLGDEQMAAQPAFVELAKAHAEMLEAYRRQDWAIAARSLASAREHYRVFGIGGLHDLMAGRIAELRVNPPPADWDGVFQAMQK
ncbi:CHASE2 domain-containing protein [Aurantiacibacter gilvus]|uniref:Adenylate/guanylate cyclase domain-containing protein n=1 Tax=Aurantiacibacter gilvus TaxID=3139141 RepID=A0ABU9IC86_9SPHN